jgi:anti-sigma regulatory factor (Ser/Thr protein kinase)
VQFYENDADLIARASEYLSSDGVPVVIAAASHRAALATALGERPDAVWLDAAETLERVDRAGFDATVGTAIRAAAAGGRPVRAFGEMVALLWERGDVSGALELEALWNGLQRELPFSLYCAYPSVADAGDFARICSAHTAVEASWDYPEDATAPSAARHHLARTLRRLGHGDALLDDARIVVTELAANAVVHARSAFSVSLQGEGSRWRIGVRDRSPALPAPPPPSPERLSGRGLQLVSAVAGRWDVEPLADGKVIWAELSS